VKRLLFGFASVLLVVATVNAQDACSSERWQLEFYKHYTSILELAETGSVIDESGQGFEPPHVDEAIVGETPDGKALACKGDQCRPVYTKPEDERALSWIQYIVRNFNDAKNAIPQDLRDRLDNHHEKVSGELGTAAMLLYSLFAQELYQIREYTSAYNRGVRKLCNLRPDGEYPDLFDSSTGSCRLESKGHN
jgi:hypothetical protein